MTGVSIEVREVSTLNLTWFHSSVGFPHDLFADKIRANFSKRFRGSVIEKKIIFWVLQPLDVPLITSKNVQYTIKRCHVSNKKDLNSFAR